MANRQYLRHPLPLFRVVAALCFPLLLWGGYRLSVSRLNPLQSLYWNDYVRTTLPDMHLLNPFGDFGNLLGGRTQRTDAPKQDMQVMLSFSCNRGHDCLVTSSLIGTKLPGLKMMLIPMQNEQFHTWLMLNIFGHRPAPWFCLLGVALALLVAPILLGIGYRLDQARGLSYRREELHIRGTELVTVKEFNRRVKGDGVGLYVERHWLVRRWMKPMMIRIKRQIEVQHQLMYGDNGSGKTVAMFGLADQFEHELDVARIYYDPEGQFLKRYWKPGDRILGPDNRGASWSPADEIDFTTEANADATAMALGESLYPGRPGTDQEQRISFSRTAHG